MKIQPFREVDIRNKIISKANPKIKSGRSGHNKGYIYLGNILVGKVTIPNDHLKIMYQSKSKNIAAQLKLTEEQFNDFVICTLKSKEYFEILKDKKLT